MKEYAQIFYNQPCAAVAAAGRISISGLLQSEVWT